MMQYYTFNRLIERWMLRLRNVLPSYYRLLATPDISNGIGSNTKQPGRKRRTETLIFRKCCKRL